jgi:predicted permease
MNWRLDQDRSIAQEPSQPTWPSTLCGDLGLSLRQAARSLRRSPAFALSVIVSLALGIGANSAIFTIIDTVLLRPLPYPRSPELLTVGLANKTGVSWHISPRDVQAWVEGVHTLSAIATFSPYPASIRGSLNTEYREGAQVSSNLLRVLGTRPAFGRWFAADDDRAGAARVVVISNEVWHQQFAGDSLVIGRTLTIYNEPWAIIGVMPRGAAPPLQAAFWIPAGTSGGQIIARPQPGVPIASIQRELARLSPSIASARAVGRPYELVIMSLHDQLYGAARSTLRLLFCAVTLLLLIACANTANLSLARVLERRHEMTVRATLGASRWSLASIVITENLLLAGAAGVLGIAVGFWTTRVFIPISPEEITRVGGRWSGSGICECADLGSHDCRECRPGACQYAGRPCAGIGPRRPARGAPSQYGTLAESARGESTRNCSCADDRCRSVRAQCCEA